MPATFFFSFELPFKVHRSSFILDLNSGLKCVEAFVIFRGKCAVLGLVDSPNNDKTNAVEGQEGGGAADTHMWSELKAMMALAITPAPEAAASPLPTLIPNLATNLPKTIQMLLGTQVKIPETTPGPPVPSFTNANTAMELNTQSDAAIPKIRVSYKQWIKL